MSECPIHQPPWERCVHLDGQWVAYQPSPGIDGLHEVTTGYDNRRGSITAPIDTPRKDWAFDDFVKSFLSSVPS